MASYFPAAPNGEGLASPLLDKSLENNGIGETHLTSTRSHASFEYERHTSYDDDMSDERKQGCCPQWLRSLSVALLGGGGIAASVCCFIYTPVHPLNRSVLVYIMGGICILNAIIMMLNEKKFLFTLPASRGAVINLIEDRKRLEGMNNCLEGEVAVLQVEASRREEGELKLHGIADLLKTSVEKLVELVKENEDNMELIRERIREQILIDVMKVIIRRHGDTKVFGNHEAKLLARKIKATVEGHSAILDEERFVQALAMDATVIGAIRAVKKLLPLRRRFQLSKDDAVYDMFYLPNNDQRQRGSVRAARAMRDGTPLSLAPSETRPSKQYGDSISDWNGTDVGSVSSDSVLPAKSSNRMREQLYQFWMMAFPYFRESTEGRCLFGTTIVLLLANSGVNVYFSYLIRDFYSALSEKEVESFYHIMTKWAISVIFLVPLQVGYRYVRTRLGINWRDWMTTRMLKLYCSNKVYYGLERSIKSADATARDYKDRRKEMDNPDQRIQEDAASFTSLSLTFFLTIISTVIDLVSFSIILFSILPKLFVAIILFATIGTVCAILIGRVLIKLNYENLQKEADFRFSLVRLRENAESIAFYMGEKVERRETQKKFGRVIDNMHSLNWSHRKLDLFQTTYNQVINFLPVFVLAQEYFNGLIDFGVIAQARQAFWHILDDFSIVINQFNEIAYFMAGIDRLFLFMKAVQELDSDRANDDATVIMDEDDSTETRVFKPPTDGIVVTSDNVLLRKEPPTTLMIRNVLLKTPDNKRTLIQRLNLSLAKGQNLLIAGVSDAGKSSLLRAIAGLWNSGHGEITRPNNVYFLPQRPYCPPGTLRDQLLYPRTELGGQYDPNLDARMSDDYLLDILTAVDLPDLASRSGDGDAIKGINSVLDWSNTLSLGEQQRLAFGRLLVNRPQLVIMDESTSALDVAAEKRMYTLMKERLVSDTGEPAAYVSVGHRPTLLAYHDLKLLLKDGSGHTSFISQQDSSIEDPESIIQP